VYVYIEEMLCVCMFLGGDLILKLTFPFLVCGAVRWWAGRLCEIQEASQAGQLDSTCSQETHQSGWQQKTWLTR